jgi:spore maturation protein CgeB
MTPLRRGRGMLGSKAPTPVTRLLIVGFSQAGHMGSYLGAAAEQLGIDYKSVDASNAEARTRIGRNFYWHLYGKRPARLRRFGAQVLDTCVSTQRDVVLTTGRAPLKRWHIERLRGLGIKVINYSTDDPWNPVQRAEWFLSALPAYDAVFTPRHANFDDLRRLGVRAVYYLPFAHDPDIHRPWPKDAPASAPSDVIFVGGCDADRLPLISALIDQGLQLALFGGYWGRHSKTRALWRGMADQNAIRSASAAARICLCLVRRANRDGHTMRSFEAAAIGGCILAEDTADHRELFGPNDHAVRYFKNIPEMVQQAKCLLGDPGARLRLSFQLRQTFEARKHTYANRLAMMLQTLERQNVDDPDMTAQTNDGFDNAALQPTTLNFS